MKDDLQEKAARLMTIQQAQQKDLVVRAGDQLIAEIPSGKHMSVTIVRKPPAPPLHPRSLYVLVSWRWSEGRRFPSSTAIFVPGANLPALAVALGVAIDCEIATELARGGDLAPWASSPNGA